MLMACFLSVRRNDNNADKQNKFPRNAARSTSLDYNIVCIHIYLGIVLINHRINFVGGKVNYRLHAYMPEDRDEQPPYKRRKYV
jgi:hypothetical protein